MLKTYKVQTLLTISIFQVKNHLFLKHKEAVEKSQTKLVLKKDLFQRRWRWEQSLLCNIFRTFDDILYWHSHYFLYKAVTIIYNHLWQIYRFYACLNCLLLLLNFQRSVPSIRVQSPIAHFRLIKIPEESYPKLMFFRTDPPASKHRFLRLSNYDLSF